MARAGADGRFGPNVRVSDEKLPACPCCMPEVKCDGERVYVFYRSTRGGIKEMVLRVAHRDTLQFETTVISRDRWRYHGCPMSGGRLAARAGRVTAAWMAAGTCRVAWSSDAGGTFTAPRDVPDFKRLPIVGVDRLLLDDRAWSVMTMSCSGVCGPAESQRVVGLAVPAVAGQVIPILVNGKS
jgi:hypothetical protein